MLENLNKALQLTIMLTFIVIVLGAYTRLKDAGLGCPDWPGCYGHILAPNQDSKAWIEMIHRYVAGALSICILYIAIQGIRARADKPKLWILTTAVLLLVIYQALLGMWTVTMRLNPLVVMGHLMGGITILALLWWIFLQLHFRSRINSGPFSEMTKLSIICTVVLMCQIALGGWTSANYAALVCADFPTCQGHWWPLLDWQHAFAISGVPLENAARVTIQMAHRIGALITTILFSVLAYKLWRTGNNIYKILAGILFTLLCVQIGLGITNVLAGLPIFISLAHNAVAVLLLLCVISVLYLLNVKHDNQ